MNDLNKRLFEMHARICECLSNPKRLEILSVLRLGELSVGEIAAATHLAVPNVSQHLALLRERGIVTARREGTSNLYSIANPKMLVAFDTLREILLDQLTGEAELAERLMKEQQSG